MGRLLSTRVEIMFFATLACSTNSSSSPSSPPALAGAGNGASAPETAPPNPGPASSGGATSLGAAGGRELEGSPTLETPPPELPDGSPSLASDAGIIQPVPSSVVAAERSRLVVLTDISNEPDDEESLVRLLVYSNEMDIEGLIATTSTHLRTGTREDLLRRQLDAYEQVRENLLIHSPGFPDAAQLRAVTATGQTAFGLAAVGAGRGTAGSRLLTAAVDRDDPRPVWISVWGGANTLAQALFDVRASRSADELRRFVSKMRVYTISDQDDAGALLREQYPDLFYIVSPSPRGASEYRLSTWSGISGDRFYENGPGYRFDLVDNPWLIENVIENHGPLGALYPRVEYIMEGDTPAWLGLIDNGLGWQSSPGYGGWGGRYAISTPQGEPRPIWTNDNDTVNYAPGQTATSNQATIWRWREHYQYDFAARMDWCVAETLEDANHHPVAALNGDVTKGVLHIPAKGGSSVTLSALGSSDPDGNELTQSWFIYREAGTLEPLASLSATAGMTTDVSIPAVTSPGTVHVILVVADAAEPPLVSYRRAILDVAP